MTTNGTTPEKRCGLVVRVSTDRQVKVEEGSLKNQLQRLRSHIDYRVSLGESWREVRMFELKAVSGKNSLKSAELRELHEEIRRGNVNVVLCTSLDRISRSVKDFLTFFEFLTQYGAELVCLKQNLDSTSAGGRLLTTVMLALAEFERDQTCERNRDTTAARSERGLWNGGVLLGYDLAEKKGTLVPNASDASLVCLVFEIYLQRGSILETAKELNARGYRTKEFDSRRGKFHEARPFSWSSTHRILTNPSYIGKKVINKTARWKDDEKLPDAKRYRLVEAVWPGIVDPEIFAKVQSLMARNATTKKNVAGKVRHTFVFSRGLLHCGTCSRPMDCKSGTSAKGKTYFYYRCRECGLNVPAAEIEKVVVQRIREIVRDKKILSKLVDETNLQLQEELPQLQERRTALERDLTEVKRQVGSLLSKLVDLEGSEALGPVKEKLEDLTRQRTGFESGLEELDSTIASVKGKAVNHETVLAALSRFKDIYAKLPPYQRRELIGLVLLKAEVTENQLRLSFHGRPAAPEVFEKISAPGARASRRAEPFEWLRTRSAGRTGLWSESENFK